MRNEVHLFFFSSFSVIKPIHVKWLVRLYENLRNQESMIKKEFNMVFVTKVLRSNEIEPENAFVNI